MGTSTQNLTHSDFSLGYQVELGVADHVSEGEDDDSAHDSVTFQEWTQHGDSNNDTDNDSDNSPDSTVKETVPVTRAPKEGLVPYVGSDSEDATTQVTDGEPSAAKPPPPKCCSIIKPIQDCQHCRRPQKAKWQNFHRFNRQKD